MEQQDISLRDLRGIMFENVTIYRGVILADGTDEYVEFEDLYKGNYHQIPEGLLDEKIHVMYVGYNKNGLADIRIQIKEEGRT